MSEFVRIDIPARAEHLLVVRLAASGVCSRLGMGIEQMEDLKAAVAEACIIMINDEAGYERLTVTLELGDRLTVSVAGEAPGGTPQTDGIDADLSLALLDALVTNVEMGEGCVRFAARGGSKH